MFALWSVEIKIDTVGHHISIKSCATMREHRRPTSRRAADRAMNSVIHQTTAPIGRVMSNAVPASVPTTRGGHTSNAYYNKANKGMRQPRPSFFPTWKLTRGKFKNIKWKTLAQYSPFPTGLQNRFHPSDQVPTCSPFSSSPQHTPLHHPLLIPLFLLSKPSASPSTPASASVTPSPTPPRA